MTATLVAANPLAARHVGALIIIVKARHFYDTALAAVDWSAKIAASGVSISVATPISTLIIGPVTVISPTPDVSVVIANCYPKPVTLGHSWRSGNQQSGRDQRRRYQATDGHPF
jgi:hypothetical protein